MWLGICSKPFNFFMNQFWLRYMCSCAAWEQDLFFHSRVLVLRPACSHIVSGIIEWWEQQHWYVLSVWGAIEGSVSEARKKMER